MRTRKVIKIALSGMNWVDISNGVLIKGQEELINYVNSNKMFVDNEDSFLRKNEFWYNQENKSNG